MLLHLYFAIAYVYLGYNVREDEIEYGKLSKIPYIDLFGTILAAFLWPVAVVMYIYWWIQDRAI